MVTFKGSRGETIPLTIESDREFWILRPQVTLSPGRHEVSYQDFCRGFNAANQLKQVPVNVGAAVALPTWIGTVSAEQATFAPGNQGCFPATNLRVAVTIDLSPELAHFRELARLVVSLDGEVQEANYGDYRLTGPRAQFSFDGKSCSRTQASFKARVHVTAHVAGSHADPAPLMTDIDVACPYAGMAPKEKIPDCSSSPVAVDAAAPDAKKPDAGAPSSAADASASAPDVSARGPSLDMAAAPQASPNPAAPVDAGQTPSTKGSGCSLARGADGRSSAVLLFFLAMGALGGARRRRR
jgi:hypothetical protein